MQSVIHKLSIQNYAIIERLEIDFSDKLNVITGETGAGKSIIVGALALILGERADTSVLVNKEKKCFVEGIFDFKLHWTPRAPVAAPAAAAGPEAPPTASDPAGASIFTAVQELGLKLEAAKAPLEVLIIDSVQKLSEN